MAGPPPEHHRIDPKNGFCPQTRTFHSLRPEVPLPSPTQPLSLTDYTLSLLHHSSPPPGTAFLIDAATGLRLTYTDFLIQTRALSSSLQKSFPSLSKNDVALILCPSSLQLPVLYFSLLSLGVTISPANPLATESEITHIIGLSKPIIAFTTTSVTKKLKNLPSLPLGIVLIDTPEFQTMTNTTNCTNGVVEVKVYQSDSAAILHSSGTTGRVKGVELTHRNFIALIGGFYYLRREPDPKDPTPVSLFTLPLFHVFGFFMLVRGTSMGETMVLMERFDFEGMLRAVERYKVHYMPVSPPLVVALAKSELVEKYDLSSLQLLGCGGAPLGKEVAQRFAARFPNVEISQGYGLTETGGGAARLVDPAESERNGTVGRLAEMMEAKIVDPASAEALGPNQRGELWLRGPTVMKGYIGDAEATAATLDLEGWLKTGDLCYFDSDGYLYILDRLKELIKYKAYQVPPAELEHLLLSNPEIADAAVIPYPDEEAGQIPMAFVVRKPGSNISAAQIMDSIARQVAPYKKIRRVAFISTIPKSPAGKILRRELVNHAVSGASSRL